MRRLPAALAPLIVLAGCLGGTAPGTPASPATDEDGEIDAEIGDPSAFEVEVLANETAGG